MKRDLKEKIKGAYESEIPDMRESVLAACENETQFSPITETEQRQPRLFLKLVAVAASIILFISGFFIGCLVPKQQPIVGAETHVYLDVNPSLELSLDADKRVLACRAANQDAEMLLQDMQLEGVELKTALIAIVGSMYVKGYLNVEDNSMLISVDTKKTENTSSLLSYITAQVNDVFANSEMECAIIAQGVSADDELNRRAEECGVSVGKMHLVDKLIGSVEGLTEVDIKNLAEMSIKDLNLIYCSKPNKGEEPPHDELISGQVPINVQTAEDALGLLLTKLEKSISEIETFDVFILPSKHGEKKAVYVIHFKLYGDGNVYRYEVDCHTGEITAGKNDGSPDEDRTHGDDREDNFGDAHG